MADPIKYTDIDALKNENSQSIQDIKDQPGTQTNLNSPELRQQRRINRASVVAAKENNIVSSAANAQGVDVNTPYTYPVTEGYGKKLVDTLSNHLPEEDRPKLSTFIESIPNPNYVSQTAISPEDERAKAKLQRKVRWADALYAFGEGMQGRTANKENMGATRLQRERDKRFQDYKNISEANKATAYNWEVASRKEALDWINRQLDNEALDARERRKYEEAARQLGKELAAREKIAKRDAGLKSRGLDIEKEKIDPTVARGSVGINGRNYDYDLKASDIPDLSSKAKSDKEFLDQHPEFFVEYVVGDTVDLNTGMKTPVTERRLNISDIDLALAYKNRFANKKIIPVSQIPLSSEAYGSQQLFNQHQQQSTQEPTPQQPTSPTINPQKKAAIDSW